ncbi:sensor histidine kinase [Rhodoflexus sp.]
MRPAAARPLLPVLLMAASLVLLMVLQFLWLTKSFNEARQGVRRELSNMFERSVRHVQDSLAMRLMDSLGINRDSIAQLLLPSSAQTQRVIVNTHSEKSDSLRNSMFIVSLSAKGDSLSKNYLKFSPRRMRFVNSIGLLAAGIRIDSSLIMKRLRHEIAERQLRVDSIAIASLQLSSPPSEEEWRKMREAEAQSPHILRERIFILPGVGYEARMQGFIWNVWQHMLPLILFSLFLTSVTVAAFGLMYQSLRRQERLAELKNDFIGNVTHELKTPVATVSVAIEALSNFNVLQNTTLTSEYLEICKMELRRLSLMIDQIMKIAIFEEKGIQLENTNVDLDVLVRKVMNAMRPQFQHFQAQVNLQTIGSRWTVRGDDTHLTNILFNLLENALKYSAENPQIEVRLLEKEQDVVLEVSDNGIGIPAEYHKKIFDKFFRVPTGNVHNVKGYGLGLSYVANVVKSHGGDITLQSIPMQGSTFAVRLPKIVATVNLQSHESSLV